MSSIFVCPKCKNVSETKTRCFSGTFCDRDDGEERVEYSPVEKPQANTTNMPFRVGDDVLWLNKTLNITRETLPAKVIEIVQDRVVAALVSNPEVKRAFAFWEWDCEWRCGCMVLVRA